MALLSNGTKIGPDDYIILVIGASGSGKSTFIDIASSRKEKRATDSLEPNKSKMQTIRISHPDPSVESSYILVEAPGIDEAEGRPAIQEWLKDMQKKDVELSAIIYLQPISDGRVPVSPLNNLRQFSKLCNDDNIVLVTTMWGDLGEDVDERRHIELASLLQHGTPIKRFENTPLSAWTIIDKAVCGDDEATLFMDDISDLASQLGESSDEFESQTEGSEDSHCSDWTYVNERTSEKHEKHLVRAKLFDAEFNRSSPFSEGGKPLHIMLQMLIRRWEKTFRNLWDAVHRGDDSLIGKLKSMLEMLGQKIVKIFRKLEKRHVMLGRSLRMILTFCKEDYIRLPGTHQSICERDMSNDDSEIFIAVLGHGGSGKSQFINYMTGSNLEVFDEGANCARPVQLGDAFEWCGRTVTLIDTPGLDVSNGFNIMRGIFNILQSPQGKKMDGIIYLLPIFPGIPKAIPDIVPRLTKSLCEINDLKKLIIIRTWDEGVAQSNEEAVDGATIVDYPNFNQEIAPEVLRSEILDPILGARNG
ncbi:hypothetical protein BDZ94DRAFT_1269648 [Collybia nuda]|uniref:G domain-containing protein n=1 Tax=Collybia nuda TaxID=64659 RepID=A0A9P5Y029_9AGAR|nr:hypothetical protein BDZ94DRAFT_1269648 [Collybia nuda]